MARYHSSAMQQDDAEEFVSKTKRKQELLELQAFGASLVDLPNAVLDQLGLEEDLLRAILEAKQMKSHGARRRQLLYVGKLMRDIDPAPIRARLADLGVRR